MKTEVKTKMPEDWVKGHKDGENYAQSNNRQHPSWPWASKTGVANIGYYNSGFAEGMITGSRKTS
jgi:hypothetical protein